MRILLKFPTRGRPQQFLTTLHAWIHHASHPEQLSALVSYDEDDETMTPAIAEEAERLHPMVITVRGKSASKIDACNRDLADYEGSWDIVLLISDDMWCRRQAWDDVVRRNMQRHFPDTDGALWFYDNAQRAINTMECVGRKRWEYFGYLYHPSYRSFWCDNEQTEVGVRDNKLVRVEHPIASHEHPAWCGGMKKDATYIRNNPFWRQDEANYHARKAAGFPR